MYRFMTLFAGLLSVCFLGIGLSFAQGDPPELPQRYENDEIGLSFDLPEAWVVSDRSFPYVYVANSEASMNDITVRPGHLFISMRIESVEDWQERIETDEPITPIEAMGYYEDRYLADPTATEISLPVTVLEAFELPATTYAGYTTSRDWIYIIVQPDDEWLIWLQAATVNGEMEPYREAVYAFANTIRYTHIKQESYRFYPTRFESDDLNFSFEYPGWMAVGVIDENTAIISDEPEAVIAQSLVDDASAYGILQITDLESLAERYDLDSPDVETIVAAVIAERFPDSRPFDQYEYETEIGPVFMRDFFIDTHIGWVWIITVENTDTVILLIAERSDATIITTILQNVAISAINPIEPGLN